MFPSDAFKTLPAFGKPGKPGMSEDILKKTEELLARFEAERSAVKPVNVPVPAIEAPAPVVEAPVEVPVPPVVAPVPVPAPAPVPAPVVAPVIDAATVEGLWRVGLDLGVMHSLKVDSVKQNKNGLVYAVDVGKDYGDYGYGLNYTKYPRDIKDNLMVTASKKFHLAYFKPVVGVELGTAKHSNARHLAWNVNLGNETQLNSNLSFVSKMNYSNFGKNSSARTSTYGLHYAF